MSVYVWIVHQELIICMCFRYNHFSISHERVFVCFDNKRIRGRSIMFTHVVDIVSIAYERGIVKVHLDATGKVALKR